MCIINTDTKKALGCILSKLSYTYSTQPHRLRKLPLNLSERARITERERLTLISTKFAVVSKSRAVDRYRVWEELCYIVVGQHRSVEM